MRRVGLVVLLLGIGCQGVVGPWQRRARPEAIDDRRLTISEQEVRGRDRLALPEPSNDVAPRTYAENPAYKGRISQ